MAQDIRQANKALRPLALLTSALLLSACAYTGGITPQEENVRTMGAVEQYMPATRDMRDNIETQELFAQAAFWSHEYELNPTDLEATLKLAAAVRKLGNPSRAVEITQTSRQIHPRDPYLLAEHAAGLIADQRAMDAIPVLDDALRIAPGYARLWSLRGAALDQMEDYDSARGHYDRALQITPNDPNILTNLGLSHALSGNLPAAEMWLRRAAGMPNAGASARQNLALVLQLQGRADEAEHQQRLAGLSRGDRKLPPAPVPALTPRGLPAQMSSSNGQALGTVENPRPYNPSFQNSQAAPRSYTPNPYTSNPASAQPASRSPFARQTTQRAPAPLHGGVPSTRLSTTAPNGQAYTSASQAARQAARSGGQTAPTAPQTGQYNYRAPVTGQQQSVLDSIRQSLQPGAVGPTPQTASGPQPHVVGPALHQNQPQQQYAQGQGYAPQQGQMPYPDPNAPYGTYDPQGYAPQGYAPQSYQQPPQQTSQGPARNRRR